MGKVLLSMLLILSNNFKVLFCGEELGEVTDVEPGVAQDRLVVTTPDGDDVAVPFVEALVPAIDPEAGTVTLAPPGGLFPGRGQAEEAR